MQDVLGYPGAHMKFFVLNGLFGPFVIDNILLPQNQLHSRLWVGFRVWLSVLC